jgi:hypothetical protein
LCTWRGWAETVAGCSGGVGWKGRWRRVDVMYSSKSDQLVVVETASAVITKLRRVDDVRITFNLILQPSHRCEWLPYTCHFGAGRCAREGPIKPESPLAPR